MKVARLRAYAYLQAGGTLRNQLSPPASSCSRKIDAGKGTESFAFLSLSVRELLQLFAKGGERKTPPGPASVKHWTFLYVFILLFPLAIGP